MKRYLCKCSAGYMLFIPQSLNPRSYIYQKSTPARWFKQVKLLRTVLLWNCSEMTQYFPFFPAGWLVNSSETVYLNGVMCDQWQVANTAHCCCQSWRLASESLAKAKTIRPFIHSFIQFYGLPSGREIINTTNHLYISPFNTLRTNTNLNYIQRPSPYLAVNTPSRL